MSADQSYVRGLVRIVTKSGTVTELMFRETADAEQCHVELWQAVNAAGGSVYIGPCVARDHFGHVVSVMPAEIAMTVLVDLRAEIEGQVAKAWEMQKGQERHNERVAKTQNLARAAVQNMPQVGGLVLPHLRG